MMAFLYSTIFLPNCSETDLAEFLAPINTYFQATLDYRPDKLEEVLHKDYIEISPIGDIDLRAQTIGYYAPELKEKTKTPDSFTVSDPIKTNLSDSVFLIVYKITYQFKAGEKLMELPLRASTVLKNESGHFKIVSNHFTAYRPKPKAK